MTDFDGPLQSPFIASLKTPFRVSADSRRVEQEVRTLSTRSSQFDERAGKGEAGMARFDISDCANAAIGATNADADTFFDLGMMYSTGRSVPIDYVTAHKWFNVAAAKGNKEAIRLRREIAAEIDRKSTRLN